MHDILLVGVEHLHMSGKSFLVVDVVASERVAQAEVQNGNDNRHDAVDALEVD